MIMIRASMVAVALCLGIGAAGADESGLIVKPSAFGVIETVDRLEDVLADRGITVFARLDHGEGARRIQAKLPATELLLFGNPKLGTPLMQSAREVGIDLPLKALVWQDDAGKVWLAYNDPRWIVARHGIQDENEIVETMTGALDQITDATTGAE